MSLSTEGRNQFSPLFASRRKWLKNRIKIGASVGDTYSFSPSPSGEFSLVADEFVEFNHAVEFAESWLKQKYFGSKTQKEVGSKTDTLIADLQTEGMSFNEALNSVFSSESYEDFLSDFKIFVYMPSSLLRDFIWYAPCPGSVEALNRDAYEAFFPYEKVFDFLSYLIFRKAPRFQKAFEFALRDFAQARYFDAVLFAIKDRYGIEKAGSYLKEMLNKK